MNYTKNQVYHVKYMMGNEASGIYSKEVKLVFNHYGDNDYLHFDRIEGVPSFVNKNAGNELDKQGQPVYENDPVLGKIPKQKFERKPKIITTFLIHQSLIIEAIPI